jgi:hypothetical protein
VRRYFDAVEDGRRLASRGAGGQASGRDSLWHVSCSPFLPMWLARVLLVIGVLASATAAAERSRAPRMPGVGSRHASRWTSAVESALRTATVVHDEPNPVGSANKTRIVTLQGQNGRRFRAVWKPAGGEDATIEPYPAGSPFAGASPYPLKSLFQNEVRTAKLAALLGLTFLVPPTVERTIDGEKGSLQLYVEHATLAHTHPSEAELDRAATEKLRVFDFVIGNADRMASNLLIRRVGGRLLPVAIDNALTFPHGTTRGLRERPFPTDWLTGHDGPFLEETQAFIRAIDRVAVARLLLLSGAGDRQVAHVLRRIERLRRDARFLEIDRPGSEGVAEMLTRVTEAAESRTQGLSQDDLDEINQVIAAARP